MMQCLAIATFAVIVFSALTTSAEPELLVPDDFLTLPGNLGFSRFGDQLAASSDGADRVLTAGLNHLGFAVHNFSGGGFSLPRKNIHIPTTPLAPVVSGAAVGPELDGTPFLAFA